MAKPKAKYVILLNLVFLSLLTFSQEMCKHKENDWQLGPMRPKARGLVQHGGPPGWLWEIDPAGVTLWVMGGMYRLAAYLFRTVPVSLTGAAQLQADESGAAQLRADGISS